MTLCKDLRVYCKFKTTRHLQMPLTYLLLVSFLIFFLSPDYSMDGIVEGSPTIAPEKFRTRLDDPFRGKPGGPADLGLSRGTSGLCCGFSLSILRFDFKQNLRTWPVLSNGI